MNTRVVLGIAAAVAIAGVTALQLAKTDSVISPESWPDGGKPAQVDCYKVTGLPKGGTEYLTTVECVSRGAKPPSPADMDIAFIEPTAPIATKREVYVGSVDGGFECACSTGSSCERFILASSLSGKDGGWATAPAGLTLGKSKWRGTGCVRKACAELFRSDVTSWPSQCPTK